MEATSVRLGDVSQVGLTVQVEEREGDILQL